MFIRPESLNRSNEYTVEDEVSKDGENGLSGWKDQTIDLVRVGNGINNFGILSFCCRP